MRTSKVITAGDPYDVALSLICGDYIIGKDVRLSPDIYPAVRQALQSIRARSGDLLCCMLVDSADSLESSPCSPRTIGAECPGLGLGMKNNS